MKNGIKRFARVSIGEDIIFANFDLELGFLGTKHPFVESIIIPAGDDWYQYSMVITSSFGTSFVVYLVITENAIRAEGNTTTCSTFICIPHMELVQVIRAANIILYDVGVSLFRLYGVRNLIGPMGRRGLLGLPGESIVTTQGPQGESIVGPQCPPRETIVVPQGPFGESIVGP
jgi:hypothetical protein